jgi:Mg2+ and Co2+ transporter CorA
MADNKNKVTFVFTAVATVFLPLSFFTSYLACIQQA